MGLRQTFEYMIGGLLGTRENDRLNMIGGIEDKIFSLQCQKEDNYKKVKNYIDSELKVISEIQTLINDNQATNEDKTNFVEKVNNLEEKKKDLDMQLKRADTIIDEEIEKLRLNLKKCKIGHEVVKDFRDNKKLSDLMN